MISQPAHRVRSVAIVIVVALSAVGCSSTTAGYEHAGQKAATVALGQVGVPYRFGGSSPTGFDCSGLVQYSYASAGISIPRTTSGQWTQMTPVRDGDMRAGDLLFFEIAGRMSHVGLYLGDGRFVHAPSSGRSVSIGSLESAYYGKAFIRAGRPR